MPAPRNLAPVHRSLPVTALPRPRLTEEVTQEPVQAGVFAAWAAADPDCLLVVRGHEPRIVWANRAAAEAFSRDESELVGRALLPLLAGASEGLERPAADELLDPRRALHREVSVIRRDGETTRSLLHSVPVDQGWVVRISPEHDPGRVADDLRLSHERFQALADRAPVGIFSSEAGLRLAYVNDVFGEAFGEGPDDLLGTRWLTHLHPDDQTEIVEAMTTVLTGTTAELSARILRPDGAERSVRVRLVPVRTQRRAGGFVGTLEDVTDRLDWEATLAHQAGHDPLTGLCNRRGLLEALAGHVPARTDGRAVLLFLDLDDFKLVNDSLGHEHGDALLVEVGRRLVGAVREGDLVSRFGGDEFAVLCTGVEQADHAEELASRLLNAVTAPFALAGMPIGISGSLGVVVVGAGHQEAEDVLRDADAAMYQAKAAGKDRWVLFDDAARENHRRRHELVTDLRRALENNDLTVAYQPVLRLEQKISGAPYAVEALARWQHPTLGQVSPQEFVALAEENGLIGALSHHMLRNACTQLAAWQLVYGDDAPSRVCVNVSPLQLRQAGFVHEVASVLEQTGLPGTSLCLELTESAVMEDPTLAAASFAALRELGVKVAIDDFGTGYSSLALLRTLPVDLLKVDRSFLSEIDQAGSARVVAAVVGLGAALGLEVVAEGVETQQQVDELIRLGCPYAQGFLYSRPLSPSQLEDLADRGWPW
jgi:diguanylate cyclase (GGDEF)-like protein/PAS domain S-box-containing protein